MYWNFHYSTSNILNAKDNYFVIQYCEETFCNSFIFMCVCASARVYQREGETECVYVCICVCPCVCIWCVCASVYTWMCVCVRVYLFAEAHVCNQDVIEVQTRELHCNVDNWVNGMAYVGLSQWMYKNNSLQHLEKRRLRQALEQTDKEIMY